MYPEYMARLKELMKARPAITSAAAR